MLDLTPLSRGVVEMSYTEVTSQLATISNALSSEDTERLDHAMAQLTDAYDSIKITERAQVARLQAARTDTNLSSDEQSAITTYERSFMTTYFGRGGFIGGVEFYLLDPAEADAEELAAQASTLANREQHLQESSSEAKGVLDAVSVPARLGILSFSAVDSSPVLGDTATIELTLENIGDEPAEDVNTVVEVPTEDNSLSSSYGSLPARTREREAFEIPATTGGKVEISITIESTNAGSVSKTTTLTVRTKESIVRNAKNSLERLQTRVQSAVGQNELSRSITSKLDAAIQSLKRALKKIDANQSKEANKSINTAINQLGALLNELLNGPGENGNGKKNSTQGKGSRVPDTFKKSLVNHTELTINQLSDARNAPLAG